MCGSEGRWAAATIQDLGTCDWSFNILLEIFTISEPVWKIDALTFSLPIVEHDDINCSAQIDPRVAENS